MNAPTLTPTIPTAEEPTDDELFAAAIADEEAAAKAAELAAKAKKIERFKLKKRFEQECGGPEGRAFVIVDTIAGFVVLKKGPGILFKQLQKTKVTAADGDAFIQQHAVYPDKDRLVAILDEYTGIPNDLLNAAVALYGANVGDRAKK